MGSHGKIREITGTFKLIQFPPKTIQKFEDAIDIMDDGMVSADVIMRKMGWKKKTLQNNLSAKVITRDMYRVLPNGAKEFDYEKVMTIRKNVCD
jgi:hypothetical protein